jgi:hypothetical protein
VARECEVEIPVGEGFADGNGDAVGEGKAAGNGGGTVTTGCARAMGAIAFESMVLLTA